MEFMISWIRFMVYQHKLANYLREHHTEKWKYLTTIAGFGPGYANSRKGMKFIFSKEDLNDAELLRLKVITRNSFIHTIGGGITAFISFAVGSQL